MSSEERTILIDRLLDDDEAVRIEAEILRLVRADPAADILLSIKSTGGSSSACRFVADVMARVPCDVVTYATGTVAGMAVVVLAAGTRGKRYAGWKARVDMSCPVVMGRLLTSMKSPRRSRAHRRELAQMVTAKTGTPYVTVYSDVQAGRSFDAARARWYGIVDEVVKSRPLPRRRAEAPAMRPMPPPRADSLLIQYAPAVRIALDGILLGRHTARAELERGLRRLAEDPDGGNSRPHPEGGSDRRLAEIGDVALVSYEVIPSGLLVHAVTWSPSSHAALGIAPAPLQTPTAEHAPEPPGRASRLEIHYDGDVQVDLKFMPPHRRAELELRLRELMDREFPVQPTNGPRPASQSGFDLRHAEIGDFALVSYELTTSGLLVHDVVSLRPRPVRPTSVHETSQDAPPGNTDPTPPDWDHYWSPG